MATQEAEDAVPKEIAVGPYNYVVSFDSEASYDYGYLGVCLNRSRRIKLDPRQSDTELPQTLLHELLHAIGAAYEIEELAYHKHDDKQKITDKIDLIASALLQTLRRNKHLVDYLVGSR